MTPQEQIEWNFSFHPANENTAPLHENVRSILKEAALTLVSLVPLSRERSLMITNLEQAMFWASAAVAREM